MLLRRLARLPTLAVRQLRWRSGSWSRDSDREYHERLYQAQDYDPFRSGYPGYVTIRRFADHVEALIPPAGTVLDVGCGPGEITCELARRHPSVSFVGIDHSEQAIERANQNAARLGLTNVHFSVGDAEQLPPQHTYGLVTMCDSFHHLERPHQFLAWLQAHTSRCVLIEPAGTPTGGWARRLDLDWLLSDLANIRDRLEALCGAPATTTPSPASEAEQLALPRRGEGAVERRYALEDFEEFFKGWHLRVMGTIAGFDGYPPAPHAHSPLRPVMGDLTYGLIRAVEEHLEQSGMDGAAKHWVITATAEAGVIESRLPDPSVAVPRHRPERSVVSAFDVSYQRYQGPTRVRAEAQFRAIVEFHNTGWDEWRSLGDNPVRVSYHWLSRAGEILDFEGLRSDLPRTVGPGDGCSASLVVKAPSEPGLYILAIDIVKEGVTWFSEAGMPWHRVTFRVSRR